MCRLLHFLLLLFLLSLSFSSIGRIHALRSLGDGAAAAGDLADAAVDLNSSTFHALLKDSPASFAVVEFFAHWCPACRNYKPQYEKVARLFNGPNAVHPGVVLMTRVDCALKINTDLCGRFSVTHYPMLLWGPPSRFTIGRWDPKQDKTEIERIEDCRTADRLLNWINKKLGSSFNLADEKFENENTLLRNSTNPDEIARAIYDVEEATAKAFEIIIQNKMIKSSTRASLVKFLQLLVAHHPSRRCRKGTAEILVNFDDMWPSDHLSKGTIVQNEDTANNHICGKEVPRGYWIFCRGSKNDTRGFSCGLWVLFHSLSVRVGDEESNLVFTGICDFIQSFFVCEECRMHFHEMSSRVLVPFNRTRDLALWFWSAHNQVNERLMKEEKTLDTGDPKFPKVVWPPKNLCPSCYLSSNEKSTSTQIEWNKDEVFKFLVNYYGRTLASTTKDINSNGKSSLEVSADDVASSTNAVAVPVGAALAIALASCAFGALACFWRAQQKNRKQRKNLDLKNRP